VSARFYTFCTSSVLLLLVSHNAFADGAYQWTDDRRKALVWNNDPQPGDIASWSGERDADGYATGPGTLSWYRFNRGFITGSNIRIGKTRVPISTYSGTMARGKFNGGVMTVDHGNAYHARFVDGRRKGQWSAGPLITKAESAESASAKSKTAEAAQSTESATEQASEKIAGRKTTSPTEGESDIPAEGPSPAKPETLKSSSSKSTNSESTPPLIAQASTESSDESATPREPVTRRTALAPGAVRAIERPSSAAEKKPEHQGAKSEKIERRTKGAKSASSEPPATNPSSIEETPAEGPHAPARQENLQPSKLKSEQSAIEPSKPAAKETPFDDSIESLTGPPPSLRTKNPSETNPPPQGAAAARETAASPVAGSTKLTAVNAMDIADIEARTHGYDLGEYELPKAEYNAASDTWLVSYAPRQAASNTKNLSVVIQDKNGKAEIKK
jgi:hypothetical protein